MNSIDFCFWLQGVFEVGDVKELDKRQVEIIKDHLHLVFKHEIDPVRDKESNVSSEELYAAHGNDFEVRC